MKNIRRILGVFCVILATSCTPIQPPKSTDNCQPQTLTAEVEVVEVDFKVNGKLEKARKFSYIGSEALTLAKGDLILVGHTEDPSPAQKTDMEPAFFFQSEKPFQIGMAYTSSGGGYRVIQSDEFSNYGKIRYSRWLRENELILMQYNILHASAPISLTVEPRGTTIESDLSLSIVIKVCE